MAEIAMAEMSLEEMANELALLNTTVANLQDDLKTVFVNEARIWRITAAIFVFLMQLGFSLLEAGTVRFKNTRNIMLKNVLDTCVCAMAFWMFGYGIGFGRGTRFFGWEQADGENAIFGSMNGVNAVEWFFQFTFAATSTTIIAGAVAERTHLLAYLFYNFFLSSLIYPVIAHMVWAENGWLSASRRDEILGTNGVLDNAGSMVVHVTGGITSLVGAWMVGPRIGRFDIEGKPVPFKGHSMVYIAAGTLILWVGFFAFNSGSVNLVEQDPSTWTFAVARVCMNTTLSAAFAGFTVFSLTYGKKEPTLEDTFNAVIGGSVSACATSSLVQPYAAAIVGIGSGLSYLAGVWCMYKLKIDDVVMAVPTHLFCGTWGALAVGLFATPWHIRSTYSIQDPLGAGIFHGGDGKQIGVQIIGLLFVYAWVGLTSFFLFWGLSFFGVLRVKRKQEEVGLDVAFHGGEEENLLEAGDGQPIARRFALKTFRRKLKGTSMFGTLLRRKGPEDKTKKVEVYTRQNRKEIWHKALESTPFGHFSLSMYEANYIMEDAGEVESSSSGVYVGVHNGHGGTEAAEFLRENLYQNLKAHFVRQGGGISAKSIRSAFLDTEEQFADIVRDAFETTPQLATAGASSLGCIITANAVWVGNVGDCRAVLGQVRKSTSGLECRALQISVNHSLSIDSVQEQFVKEHLSTPDVVTDVGGICKVKGKIPVTRSFGDLYLKAHEFNREPLFHRFRVSEPFHPPLISGEPSVTVRVLSPHDAFLIVATDGLFQLLTNQEAVDVVARSPKKDAARGLIIAALQHAAQKYEINYQDLLRMPSGQRKEFHDDITVVVFFFDHEARNKANRDNLWDTEGSLKGGVDGKMTPPEGVNSGEVEIIGTVRGTSLFAKSTSSRTNSSTSLPEIV